MAAAASAVIRPGLPIPSVRGDTWRSPSTASLPAASLTACSGSFSGQPSDAYAALKYLSRQSFVAPERFAVLGNSMGGYSALSAVDRDLMAQYFREQFRAAVAYYPSCGIPAAMMTVPALILIGEADGWTPAERCREMAAHARRDGASIELIVYPERTTGSTLRY
jgi:dienelactone hydrolase